MNIFVGHTTAIECLRIASLRGTKLTPAEVRHLPSAVPNATDMRELYYELHDTFDDESPVDILVADAGARRPIEHMRFHVWSGFVPDGAFLNLNDMCYVASPEFAFLQMASILSIPELAQLGCELCGRYAIRPQALRGFDLRDKPLTSPLRLAAFLEKAKGCYGHKRAVRALRWVVPNSWSPMETDIALLLCMPTRVGGYQFPTPELNRRIDIDDDFAYRTGNDWYYLDLSWKEGKIALEYNGEEDHSGRNKIGRDRTREAIIAQHHVDLTVITSFHVLNMDEFDLITKALSAKLGRRHPDMTATLAARRRKLRGVLLARLGQGIATS